MKVGEIRYLPDGTKYECVEDKGDCIGCDKCMFKKTYYCRLHECFKDYRHDNTYVIFTEKIITENKPKNKVLWILKKLLRL